MQKTYLKYIELELDDFETQITNEVNCPDNEQGKERIENLKNDAEKQGRTWLIVKMQPSCAPVII